MAHKDQRSAEAAEYRKLYKTARWARLRDRVLNARPLCVMCHELDEVTEADTVDHIKPHKGDEALFWDVDNLQPLCASCHSRHKQREERGTGRPAIGLDGYPVEG